MVCAGEPRTAEGLRIQAVDRGSAGLSASTAPSYRGSRPGRVGDAHGFLPGNTKAPVSEGLLLLGAYVLA
jgi:hypothetical protein